MAAVSQLIKFANGMCGGTESALRLTKAAGQYCHLGYRFSDLTYLKHADELLKVVCAFQNPYRVVKAGSLFLTLRKVGQEDYDDGGLKPGSAAVQTWGTEIACWTHQVVSYLSPLTLATVSAPGFVNYLASKGVLPLSKICQGHLSRLCKYGGGYFGNGLAAFSGAFGSYHLNRKSQIEAGKAATAAAAGSTQQAVHTQKSKEDYNGALSGLAGSAKYSADFVATVLGHYLDADGFVIVVVKLLSNHLAVGQSSIQELFKAGLI